MYREKSKSNVTAKFKSYVTGVMMKNFSSINKIDKYFRVDLTDSMSKAIEENWIRMLGIDYEIITLNIYKNNEPLGIALGCRHFSLEDNGIKIPHHYLKVIRPNNCIGSTRLFLVGDELLEVNGIKILGMNTKDVISVLKKLPNYIQVVVARAHLSHDGELSDSDDANDLNGPISFYNMDEEVLSRSSTLKSNSSLFSTTSRDYGSAGSVGGPIDGQYKHVGDYLRDIVGWRGPIVLEFRKHYKESLGLALEEIKDPLTSELIIVFKIIMPGMKAANDGRLHVGDRLLQINGKSVVGVSFRKICQWMKSSVAGKLVLYLCKPYFPAFNIDTGAYYADNYLASTLSVSDKLPKLNEETDHDDTNITPPVPESYENRLLIKKVDDKLGLYLEIADNGKNGCRIKKIVKGLAKENGVLHEGDFLTSINGIDLRIKEKNQLEHCLRTIAKSESDYQINYLTKEDVELHKSKCVTGVHENAEHIDNIYENEAALVSNDISSESPKACSICGKAAASKASFKTLDVTIENDGKTKMGLKIIPSINDPTRLVAITDIHADSLADRSNLLKINDEILSVNGTDFVGMSPASVGGSLKSLMQTEPLLHFKIKRLISADDSCDHSVNEPENFLNGYPDLSDLPDMYFIHLTKTNMGYGISVKEADSNYGVIIDEVGSNGAADKSKLINHGHRFVMINNCPVLECTSDAVIKMIKNSQYSMGIIMETPKYREFYIKVVKDSSNSLGLNVGGGIDTKFPIPILERVVKHTTCQFSEPLLPGDLIVEVNGLSMIDLDHDNIIKILRSLPQESDFKIWRKLPLIQRYFHDNFDTTKFLDTYRQSCEFTVVITKPVNTVSSFGINFSDVVVLDPISYVILDRYKAVVSIDTDSLVEKYAADVTVHCYLTAVDKVPIDATMSPEHLKQLIDSESTVELLFSRDIPYRINNVQQNCDIPLLIEGVANGFISDENPKELEHHSKRVHFENTNPCLEIHNNVDTEVVSDPVRSNMEDDIPISDEISTNISLTKIDTKFEEEEPVLNNNCKIVDNDTSSDDIPPTFDYENDCFVDQCISSKIELNSPPRKESEDSIPIIPDDNVVPIVDGIDPVYPQAINEVNEDNSDDKIRVDVTNENVSSEKYDSPKFSDNENEENSPRIELKESDPKLDEDYFDDGSHDHENISSEKNKESQDYLPEKYDSTEFSDEENSPRIELKESVPKLEEDYVDNDGHDHENASYETIIPSPITCKENQDSENDDNMDSGIKDRSCNIESINSTNPSNEQLESDLGITLYTVIVPKKDNMEIGFHIIGGVGGGPNGEALPIYVIGVERNTCNWPEHDEQPLLNKGVQLIELNGCSLSAYDVSSIEKLIATSVGDLHFKVLRVI